VAAVAFYKWQYEEPSASIKIKKKKNLSKNLKLLKNKMNTWKINHFSI
jgi:hypothetical protein